MNFYRQILTASSFIATFSWLGAIGVYTQGLHEISENASTVNQNRSKVSSDVRSLILKHRKAMFGQRDSDAIVAFRMDGIYEFGGERYPFVVRKMRPQLFRLELTTPNGIMIQGYDGSRGWLTPIGADPLKGSQWMDRHGDSSMQRDAVLFNYLIEQGSDSIKMDPLTNDAGVPGVKVTLPNGGLVNYWLNPETMLVQREMKTDFEDGAVKFRTIELSDYREIDGVQIAHRAVGYVSGELESVMNLEQFEFVDGFDEAIFQFPGAPKLEAD